MVPKRYKTTTSQLGVKAFRGPFDLLRSGDDLDTPTMRAGRFGKELDWNSSVTEVMTLAFPRATGELQASLVARCGG